MSQTKIKKFFLAYLLVYLFFAHSAVFAATSTLPTYSGVSGQIEQYLCSPTDASKDQGNTPGVGTSSAAANNSASRDLYKCINQLYKFCIALGGTIAIFFIVVAGYIYMSSDGNQESVDKAKDILVSSITAMVILLGGYVLLKAINPDLIEFKPIQPPSVKLDTSGWNTAPPVVIPPGSGTTTPGGAGPTNGMTEQVARKYFQDAGISINKQPPDTMLQGLQAGIAQEIVNVKNACGCTVIITGGTEPGHASGTYSHANGNKIDLGLNSALNTYIETHFPKSTVRSDGAQQYTSSSGAVYAKEGDHWDIVKQ